MVDTSNEETFMVHANIVDTCIEDTCKELTTNVDPRSVEIRKEGVRMEDATMVETSNELQVKVPKTSPPIILDANNCPVDAVLAVILDVTVKADVEIELANMLEKRRVDTFMVLTDKLEVDTLVALTRFVRIEDAVKEDTIKELTTAVDPFINWNPIIGVKIEDADKDDN